MIPMNKEDLMSRTRTAQPLAISMVALALGSLTAATPWKSDGGPLAYQVETHFEMTPDRLGIPRTLTNAKTVAVDARMSLQCQAKNDSDGATALSCTAHQPAVSWRVADGDVKGWAAAATKTLNGARIRIHLDEEDGHLTRVDLDTDESGPADPHWTLATTVVERSLAGFDLPMPKKAGATQWEQHETALVLGADPNTQVSQKIQHRTTEGKAGQSQIDTHGEVSFLLEGNGDTVVDATDRIEGRVSARATWDADEGRLIERTWKSEVGNGWYSQTGRLRLTGANERAGSR